MTLARVKAALRKAGIAFVDASPADWIDDAVWVGDTTLVGVSEGTITVLTRSHDEEEGDDLDTWEAPDDAFVLTVRSRLARDELVRGLVTETVSKSDLDWATVQAKLVRTAKRHPGGYAAPSGRAM